MKSLGLTQFHKTDLQSENYLSIISYKHYSSHTSSRCETLNTLFTLGTNRFETCINVDGITNI